MRFQGDGVGHSFVPIKNHDPPVEDSDPDPGTFAKEQELSVLQDMDVSNSYSDAGDLREAGVSRPISLSGSSESDEEERPEGEVLDNIKNERSDKGSDNDFDPEDGEGVIFDAENEEGYDGL